MQKLALFKNCIELQQGIFRFFSNTQKRILKEEPLLKLFVTVQDFKLFQVFWFRENQKQFSDEELQILCKYLRLINWPIHKMERKNERNALLPNESKTPCLIIVEHYFSELIVNYFHSSLKHISIKQTLTEIWQKFWICHYRNLVWKFWKI